MTILYAKETDANEYTLKIASVCNIVSGTSSVGSWIPAGVVHFAGFPAVYFGK